MSPHTRQARALVACTQQASQLARTKCEPVAVVNYAGKFQVITLVRSLSLVHKHANANARVLLTVYPHHTAQ